MKSDEVPAVKKPKLEKISDEEKQASDELLKKIEQQNKRLFKLRDQIKKHITKKDDRVELLRYNNQEPVEGDTTKLLDQLADMLCFGALEPCPQCHGYQLLFSNSGYMCNGNLTEWTKCTLVVKEPKRKACKIPEDFKESYKFLKNAAKTPETRAIRSLAPSQATIEKNIPVKKEDEVDAPKVKRERPPLYNLQYSHIGLKDKENELKKRLSKLGAKYDSKISEKTIAIFSTSEEVERCGSRMTKAKELGIHIIPMDYLESVEKDNSGSLSCITGMTLCDWGTDPTARIPEEDAKSAKSKSIYTKSVPKSMTLKIKDGLAVDPDSGLEDVAHVYVANNKDKYNVVLGQTDIQRNKNSFYKIQLLQSDKKSK